MDEALRNELAVLGIPVYEGSITEVHHTVGKVEAVSLDSGSKVAVGTLLWKPHARISSLIQNLVANLGLEIDESGWVATGELQQTNVPDVWAAGDVQGWVGGLGAAAAGDRAAFSLIKAWYS